MRLSQNVIVKPELCQPVLYSRQFVLEKHPYFSVGTAEVQSEDLTLLDFVEANA
jgi:hypothetical protein